MITTTLNEVPGRTIKDTLGLVQGVSVRSPSVSERMMGETATQLGGDNNPYYRVCVAARENALRDMLSQANCMNADAVVGIRYEISQFSPGIAEVVAYGTAVKLV